MSGSIEIQRVLPLAPVQLGMLYDVLTKKDSKAYYNQMIFSINGQMDLALVKDSFERLVQRYDILRVIFLHEGLDEPVQVVLKRDAEIHCEDLSSLTEGEREEFLTKWKERDLERGFDLSRDMPIRAAFFKLTNDTFNFIWVYHHIIMDGWCLGIIFRDFIRIYSSLLTDENDKLEPVVPYQIFIEWLDKQDKEEGLECWRDYLQGYEQQTVLPDYGSQQQDSTEEYVLQEYKFTIENVLYTKANELARKNGVTLNCVFQAVFGLLLQRYNNTTDVLYGSIASGRPAEIAGIENMVGLFSNVIPTRIRSEENDSFSSLVKRMHQEFVSLKSYEYLSLGEIQANSSFNVQMIKQFVMFQNYLSYDELADKDELGFRVDKMLMGYEQTNFDFNVTVSPVDVLEVMFSYNAKVYQEKIIQAIALHLQNVLKQVVTNSDILIKEIEITSEEEKRLIMEQFNNTAVDFPRDKIVYELFEEITEKWPERTAVVCEGRELNYHELNIRANQLAYALRDCGIRRDSFVAILCERSIEMLIGILGTFKAGGAYIPLDTNYPFERIQTILNDSGTTVLLTTAESFENWSELYQHIAKTTVERVIFLDQKPAIAGINVLDQTDLQHYPEKNLTKIAQPSDLCYVIYTSGSTGKPKGAMVEHIGMMNHMTAKIRDLSLTDESIIAQNSSQCFDISVWQFLTAITLGGKTVIYPNETVLTPERFIEGVVADKITILEVVPSYLGAILDTLEAKIIHFSELQYLLVTGEVVKSQLVKRWFDRYPEIKMVNAYGPTEASDDITHYILDHSPDLERIPIGRPLQNFHIYIVDNQMHLVPIGVKGEICVAGIGVGRGYLHDPEKTARAFMEDPFAENSGVRLYKTGDLGRWAPDGTIEFFGRKDYQVKIRGFRIELGEIESKLVEFPTIKEAIVLDKEDEHGQKYLCAYFVTTEKVNVSELREFLLRNLPDYMIPARFIEIKEMPLNANGKLDRKALPEPEFGLSIGIEYCAPTTEIEQQLTTIWQEVLGIERVGINDNFFELGGDSIKAIQVSAGLQKYKLREEIGDILRYPTIEQLSKHVHILERKSEQGPIEGEAVLTPIQQQFFAEGRGNHYNQSLVIYRQEGFNEVIIANVLQKLIEHHDALRSVFVEESQGYVQKICGLQGTFFELNIYNEVSESEVEHRIKVEGDRLQRELDIEKGPLFRAGLFKTGQGDYLLLVIHHLVVDGVSWRFILEDFTLAYQHIAAEQEVILHDKTDSYLHWAKTLETYARSTPLLRELDYWQSIEQTEVKKLLGDNEVDDTKNRIKDGKILSLNLDKANTEKLLTRVNYAYSTEINDILLAALGLAIKEWVGIDRVLLNLEGHGREEITNDILINRTVGWFTSQYPVLLSDLRENDLGYTIKNVKDTLHRIPNKGIGYGILRYLTPKEYKGDIELVRQSEIGFNYLGQIDAGGTNDFFQILDLSSGDVADPEDLRREVLSIEGGVVDGKLMLTFEFNRWEYRIETVQKLVDSYQKYLIEIIAHCTKREEKELTPTDLSYSDLSIDELNELEEFLGDIE